MTENVIPLSLAKKQTKTFYFAELLTRHLLDWVDVLELNLLFLMKAFKVDGLKLPLPGLTSQISTDSQ